MCLKVRNGRRKEEDETGLVFWEEVEFRTRDRDRETHGKLTFVFMSLSHITELRARVRTLGCVENRESSCESWQRKRGKVIIFQWMQEHTHSFSLQKGRRASEDLER